MNITGDDTNEGCKKSAELVYRKNGGTVTYKTRGDIRYNNRCRQFLPRD